MQKTSLMIVISRTWGQNESQSGLLRQLLILKRTKTSMLEFEKQRPVKNKGLFNYLKETRRYWLIPLLISAVVVAVLVGLGSSVLAPLIYPLIYNEYHRAFCVLS